MWARAYIGASGPDEVEDDARAFGIPLEAIAEAADDEGDVWDAHLPALEAFLQVSRQWRTISGFGGIVWLGLDYAAAQAGLAFAGLTITPDLWAEVRHVETGALSVLNGA